MRWSGVSVSPDEVRRIVLDFITERQAELAILSWSGIGKTVGNVKSIPSLRWASPMDIKSSVEEVYLSVFGPKEDKAAVKAKVKVSL